MSFQFKKKNASNKNTIKNYYNVQPKKIDYRHDLKNQIADGKKDKICKLIYFALNLFFVSTDSNEEINGDENFSDDLISHEKNCNMCDENVREL